MGCNQNSHGRWRQKRAWPKSQYSPHFLILIPSQIDLSPSNYPKSVENCCRPKMHTEIVLATKVYDKPECTQRNCVVCDNLEKSDCTTKALCIW